MTLEEMGQEAAELTRQDILKACRDGGLTLDSLVAAVANGLNAFASKQQMLPDGSWSTSNGLVDHSIRLTSVKVAKDILGLDAPKNIKVEGSISGKVSPETAEMVRDLISTAMGVMEEVRRAAVASLTQFSEE